jgi:hypothetical protein
LAIGNLISSGFVPAAGMGVRVKITESQKKRILKKLLTRYLKAVKIINLNFFRPGIIINL